MAVSPGFTLFANSDKYFFRRNHAIQRETKVPLSILVIDVNDRLAVQKVRI